MDVSSEESIHVFLHHGLFGMGNYNVGPIRFHYFGGAIERKLASAGMTVHVTRVHPTDTIERRARELRARIRHTLRACGTPDARVVIVGHSMGGIDARYMVSKLDMASRVQAVVTIATPHRGSPMADWVFDRLGKKWRGIDLVRQLGWNLKAIADLRTESMKQFNEQTPDHPEVRYCSISTFQTASRVSTILLPAHRIVYQQEGDNDGMVSIRSAMWGEHLETWQTDHFHAVNRRYTPRTWVPKADMSDRYVTLLKKVARSTERRTS